MRVCPQGVFILFLSYQPTPTSISQISTIRIQFIPSSPTPCIAVFAKGMVYRHVGQSVAKHLMEVVSAWRRELVHVRTAETNNINDSKHESYPTGSFYSVFVLTSNKHQPHQYNPYSIQSITHVKASHSHSHAPQHLRLFPIISSTKAEPHAKATIPTYWQASFMEL